MRIFNNHEDRCISSNRIRTPFATFWTVIAMLCAAATLPSSPSRAADASTATDTSLNEIIVTGTREVGITAAESAAPIQIISASALKAAGAPDLMTALAATVPSLQMEAFGFDMAGQTLQARLRGVSPNDVLVLINGKRRHTTANLAIDTGSPFQGGAGVDLNFIPLDAIDHVEVLTEGAAAQYGSDAIAGVINIILKRNSSGGSLDGTYGQYGNDGGGKTEDVSGNAGFEAGKGGFFNITGNFRDHGHSDFGAEDPRLFPSNVAGYAYPDYNVAVVPGYPNLNLIQGDAAVQTKLLAVNAGWDFEGGTELYFTGTYGHKYAASYENYRMPSKMNYTPNCPVGTLPADCPATVYPLPLGFNPQEANNEDDYEITGGIKGSIADWDWDVSSSFGGDHDELYTLQTVNTGAYGTPPTEETPNPYFGNPAVAQLGNIYDGTLQATQWTTNIDIRHGFDVGLASPLNLAFGYEHRRDTYTIGAGPPISYIFGGGSSYPGFTPLDQSSNSRTNDAGYLDFSAKPVSALRLDAAVRFEHYSDFGDATVGKLTGRYDFTPEFAMRGTINNGFRAPTLAEEYYSATNVGPLTAYVQLPPNSPAGKLLGLGNGLQPEKSIDFSLGFIWRPIEHMTATLDLYQIRINDRIVGSGEVAGQINGVPTPAYAGINAAIAAYAKGSQVIEPGLLGTCPPGPTAIIVCGSYGISVFANGIDTKTQGADLVFNFPFEYSFGKIDWSVSAAYNDTSITKYASTPPLLTGAVLYDQEAYSELTTASPKFVINLGALLTLDKLTVNLVEKVYGPSSDYENDDGDNPTGNFLYYPDKISTTFITNLDVGYQFTEHLKLSIGAQNLFNRFPDRLNANILAHENNAGDNAAVAQYPLFSPFGDNGGFYYVKALYKF
jgi:iron complex outermembrane receptor protein